MLIFAFLEMTHNCPCSSDADCTYHDVFSMCDVDSQRCQCKQHYVFDGDSRQCIAGKEEGT